MNNILDIVAKLSQILIGFVGLAIAFYTLVINKDLVFRNSLRNKQIEELCHLRQIMFDVWFAVFYVKENADNIRSLSGAVVDFQREQPDSWARYQTFHKNCMELFYKLQFPDYYLFPKWLNYKELHALHEITQQFAPFTILSLINKTGGEVKLWQDELLKGIDLLDKSLKAKS